MAHDALGSLALVALTVGITFVGFELAKEGDLGAQAQTLAKQLEASFSGTSSGTGAKGPPGTYNTVNGAKTVAQMHAELDLAANSGKPGGHWSGDGGDPNDTANIVKGYQKVTGGPVTGPN